MAISVKQAELMGVFKGLPYVGGYYTEKFKRKYSTIGETINFDEVAVELSTLNIIPRGTKLPVLDSKGFRRISVRPDLIGGKSSLTATDLLELQAGQFELSKNPMSNFPELRDRHLLNLKNALYNTIERMNAQAYLTGKVTLPISNEELNYNYEDPIEKDFEKKEDWQTFILGLVDEYNKSNGVYPNLIEVDMSIFKAIVTDQAIREQAKAYGTNSLKVAGKTIPCINIFGYDVVALPKALDVNGNEISTDKLVILSNTEAFTQAYAGIGYSNGNSLAIYKGEYLVDEMIEKDPASHFFTLQSGYCPVIPLAKRVKRYKLTIK